MSSDTKLENVVRPYSQSPWPAWSLAFLCEIPKVEMVIPFALLMPISRKFWRLGFSMIMYGAGYVLSTGDSLNGSGISTAWALTYLFWNGRRSFTTLRSPVSMILTGATALTAGLYGTEYFILQDANSKQDSE